MKSTHFEDPVAAYDHLAPHYAGVSRGREPYLRNVEREIISRIPPPSRSILDIGAGDGTRALRMAAGSGIRRVVLLEPSSEMRALARSNLGHGARAQYRTTMPLHEIPASNRGLTEDSSAMELPDAEAMKIRCEDITSEGAAFVGRGRQPWARADTARVPQRRHPNHISQAPDDYPQIEIWPVRAESLSPKPASERFDVITCLWNVLGHIAAENRERTLRAVAHLLSPDGKFFLDINHRYNLRAYGILPTCGRWVRDRLFPIESNGDVRANWNVGESSISTCGHVFTHREIVRLAGATGLELEKRIVINYENGKIHRFGSQGNLLYVLRRSSRIDSSSAPHTS
jgi:SAM-dependent methyltransferase